MLAVQVRGEGDGGVGGRVGILAPPDAPHRHRAGVPQGPEHDALASVLGDGALGGDADAAVAITASQSSMSWVCSTAGSVSGGHRSVEVLPVRRSSATVRWPTSSGRMERRRAQGSSSARAQ
jgi:hypothetical protein